MKRIIYKRILRLKEKEYQELFGVKKSTFEKMLEILNKGGKPAKLKVLDKLIITLCYYREYCTMQHIAFDYEVTRGTICNSIHWVENTLIKSGVFSLPSKRELYTDTKIEVVLIDATEVEIERPKKEKSNTIQEKRKNTL